MANDFLYDRYKMLKAKMLLTSPGLWSETPFFHFSAEAEPVDPDIGHILTNWCGDFSLPLQFNNPVIGKPEEWLNFEEGKDLIRDMFAGPYPPAENLNFYNTTAYTGCIFRLTFNSGEDSVLNRYLAQHYGPCGPESVFEHWTVKNRIRYFHAHQVPIWIHVKTYRMNEATPLSMTRGIYGPYKLKVMSIIWKEGTPQLMTGCMPHASTQTCYNCEDHSEDDSRVPPQPPRQTCHHPGKAFCGICAWGRQDDDDSNSTGSEATKSE